jgi:hypothetical protein
VVNNLVNDYVPVKKWPSKYHPKWLTADLLRLIRKKKNEWKIAKNYNTGPAVEKYKQTEKEVSRKIKAAKKKFEKDLAYSDDRNQKKFSNYIKSKTKIRTLIGPLKNSNNEATADKLEMANILNSFLPPSLLPKI